MKRAKSAGKLRSTGLLVRDMGANKDGQNDQEERRISCTVDTCQNTGGPLTNGSAGHGGGGAGDSSGGARARRGTPPGGEVHADSRGDDGAARRGGSQGGAVGEPLAVGVAPVQGAAPPMTGPGWRASKVATHRAVTWPRWALQAVAAGRALSFADKWHTAADAAEGPRERAACREAGRERDRGAGGDDARARAAWGNR